MTGNGSHDLGDITFGACNIRSGMTPVDRSAETQASAPGANAEATEASGRHTGESDLELGNRIAFNDLRFIRKKPNGCHDHWAPPELPGLGNEERSDIGAVLGQDYGLSLIDYMREFSACDQMGQLFADIARDFMKRGQWSAVELHFFCALGDYLATGRVNCSGGFEAIRPDDKGRAGSQ